MLLLLDNYDSFTYNLYHYLGELGAEVVVKRNDEVEVQDVLAMPIGGVVISPGPCDPLSAGISVPLVKAAAGRLPVLGVCLGHQAIAEAFGANVVRTHPMHGKVDQVRHDGSGILRGLPETFAATRYHSLTAEPASLPECLIANAFTADGTIMGLRHRELPIHGLQFHPESIASEHGHAILLNFLRGCRDPQHERRAA